MRFKIVEATLTFLLMVFIFLSAWFFFFAFIYEPVVWHKTLSQSLESSWQNIIYLVASFVAVAVLNTVIENPHSKNETNSVVIRVSMNAKEYQNYLKQRTKSRLILKQHGRSPQPQPITPKINLKDPCPNLSKNFHFGFLHKELDKKTPIPDECLTCSLKLECLEGKKPK
jgi:hypothetical protein